MPREAGWTQTHRLHREAQRCGPWGNRVQQWCPKAEPGGLATERQQVPAAAGAEDSCPGSPASQGSGAGREDFMPSTGDHQRPCCDLYRGSQVSNVTLFPSIASYNNVGENLRRLASKEEMRS